MDYVGFRINVPYIYPWKSDFSFFQYIPLLKQFVFYCFCIIYPIYYSLILGCFDNFFGSELSLFYESLLLVCWILHYSSFLVNKNKVLDMRILKYSSSKKLRPIKIVHTEAWLEHYFLLKNRNWNKTLCICCTSSLEKELISVTITSDAANNWCNILSHCKKIKLKSIMRTN